MTKIAKNGEIIILGALGIVGIGVLIYFVINEKENRKYHIVKDRNGKKVNLGVPIGYTSF